MKPAYVLFAFAFWVSFVIVFTGFLENRRDRDIRRCCSQCTPSRATSYLASEGRPATAFVTRAKVDRPIPAAFALPVEAAGPS